ncbi:class I SAM-dependent methyltransferase [Nocardia donostiensis]|uniref:SAM-dependent methyltransferase n=1 Tax=Nocardia donostiensis TaxID=1538463 RepID=A0A1W0ATM1_9NOCA|nr:class I SAM-dependent methyltransferase [Nocardia donostiensis]ONM49438.1 SAM-dependent methyltransferase [Nocardia donostiensis]OQS13583.1 SAM-dependent methyltransferase [Nocardia donostiensis]OQS19915.1 SAM-dependent methyltransferase [Nocardia donostiensis]
MDAAEWDARYAQSELVWGAPPNSTVVQHVHGLHRRTPLYPDADGQLPESPRALDLACGEGRNTLWLATHGWQVHAVDFSQVGIDKARTIASRLSRSVRGRIHWQCADVTDLPGAGITGPYELVLMVFLHLPAPQRREVVRQSARLLSPGGTLLVLGHDSSNLTDGYGGPQDPEILFTPDDIVADLGYDSDVTIQTAEQVPRATEGPDAIDALVIAMKPPKPDPSESSDSQGI